MGRDDGASDQFRSEQFVNRLESNVRPLAQAGVDHIRVDGGKLDLCDKEIYVFLLAMIYTFNNSGFAIVFADIVKNNKLFPVYPLVSLE